MKEMNENYEESKSLVIEGRNAVAGSTAFWQADG